VFPRSGALGRRAPATETAGDRIGGDEGRILAGDIGRYRLSADGKNVLLLK
jgi:hypothetical protein